MDIHGVTRRQLHVVSAQIRATSGLCVESTCTRCGPDLGRHYVAVQTPEVLKCLNVIVLNNKMAKWHLQGNAAGFLRRNFVFVRNSNQ